MPDEIYDISIIGGGLAGLTSSILLSRAGFKTILIEKKQYPFHRVCGEYISLEVEPFLRRNGLFPTEYSPTILKRFSLTANSGRQRFIDLPLGGFGISRFTFDQFLAHKATESSCEILENTTINKVEKSEGLFKLSSENGDEFLSKMVIGSFGKRSVMDKSLSRSFIQIRSPYIGVKYHLKTDHPEDLITLHNFKGGYCGISKIENDTYNLCYLSHKSNIKESGSIAELEQTVLFKNPHLRSIFENSDFIFEKPLVINEISFESKPLTDQGVLMCGDSAGMITPLCGNGMAMAIHGAHLLSQSLINNKIDNGFDGVEVFKQYSKAWKKHFSMRLKVGRNIQRLFGGVWSSELAVNIVGTALGPKLVRLTHGSQF